MEIKKKRKRKRHMEIFSFYISIPKLMTIWYTVPGISHMTDQIVIFYFGAFFALLHPNLTKNENFKRNEKDTRRYYHFTQVYQKS